jgi:hypothetical protein
MSFLMKLAGGCPSLADQLNVDAFMEQARSYEKASSNLVGWYIRLDSDPMKKTTIDLTELLRLLCCGN